jgi:hypothetical protein
MTTKDKASPMKILTKISAAIMLSLSMSAHAGAIIDWEGTGVDFYASWIAPLILRIEIDALNPGGGWADAVSIDSIAINSPDGGPKAWTWENASDITLDGPVASFESPDGSIDRIGLNADGCHKTLSPQNLGKNHPCWSGLALLTDNMVFDFKFGGDSEVLYQADNPHLKVRFVDGDGNKVGSLLSANVPEPSSLLLMGAGLFGLGFARRKKA